MNINPYEAPPSNPQEEIDPNLLRQGRAIAKTLAAGGSASGSITKKIKQLGIPERHAAEIAKDAICRNSTIQEWTGIGISCCGVALIGTGILLAITWTSKYTLSVIVFGMFLVLLGFAKAAAADKFRRSTIRRDR